jgi:endonuclease/exonuclease/phosphatase family metal-dependent hydrolase
MRLAPLGLLLLLVACSATPPAPPAPPDGGSTTAPDTRLDSGPDALTGSSGAVFTFSSPDGATTFTCSLDAASFATCSSPLHLSALADGSHTLQVAAVAGSLSDPTPASLTWTVDTQAPTVALTSGPGGTVATAQASFTFTASEPGTFQCQVDSGTFTACESGATYSGLTEGAHTFYVRALDLVGNAGTPATRRWTVDTQGPVTTLASGPSGTVPDTSATFTFHASETATFECQLSPGSFIPCSSPQSYSGLSNAEHTFSVRATDGVGNVGPVASRTWTVDSSAPSTHIDSGPSGAVASASASFTFSSDQPGTFECQLSPASFTSCSSPQSYSGLGEGSHTFSVRATNTSGTLGSTASRSWTVDTLTPDTTLASGPSGTVATTEATFTFTSNEAGASFRCSIDGGTALPCSSGVSYSGLSNGDHTFTVASEDAAGNVDPTPASATWTVAVTATRIRLMAANITSGNKQSYDPGEGTRIFQGLKPDVAMLQEFNYFGTDGNNDAADVRQFVDTAFGTGYVYYREPLGGTANVNIPNGIVSRYPILAAGEFADLSGGTALNRSYVWARIDVPGPHDLWAVSLHLHSGSSDSSRRNDEAAEIVADVQSLAIPAGDFVVIGGDFNTYSRGEACLTTFQGIVDDADDLDTTASPPLYSVDQSGDGDTNAGRSSPYDWVLTNSALQDLMVPVTFPSGNSFAHGLVFDSRVYTPLSDVSPVLASDSAASNMQHMGVVRDYLLPN